MSHENPSSSARDAELLERHLCTAGSEMGDPELERFRLREAKLVALAEDVITVMRAQVMDRHSVPSSSRRKLESTQTPRHASSGPSQRPKVNKWIPAFAGTTKVARPAIGKWAISVTSLAILSAIVLLLRTGETNSSAIQEYTTVPGQRTQLTLPDGSSVLLAPGSTVRHAAHFGTGHRTLQLEGEALFTVTHHTGAPFIVKAGAHETRVLGTTFTVRRYPTDSVMRVVVAAGRVAVGDTVMAPGDEARVTHDHVILYRSVNVGDAFAWTQGALVFRSVAFRDVIPDLKRWYDLDITVADPKLLTRSVTTTLTQENAGNVLDLLEIALEARAIRHGNHITFISR